MGRGDGREVRVGIMHPLFVIAELGSTARVMRIGGEKYFTKR